MEASRPNLSDGWCIDGCCLPQLSDYFWGAQPSHTARFAAFWSLHLLLVTLIPLGPKNNLVQKAHAAACRRAAGRGQLHETLQTC